MFNIFEIHYYDDGIKTALVPNVVRPDALPPPPGLKSTEAEFKHGDFVIELLCADRGGARVIWIACHTGADDRRLGSRGNYCGVGIWLIDHVPIYIDRLLGLLRDAALNISKNEGPNAQILRDLEVAANKFDGLGWCAPIAKLPHALWASRFAPSAIPGTTYLTTSQDEKLDFRLVGSDILHQFSRKPRPKEVVTQRRLYLRRRNSKVAPEKIVQIDAASLLESEEETISDFCEETAGAAVKYNELRTANDKLRKDHEEAIATANEASISQSQRVARLEGELNLSNRKRTELEDMISKISNVLAAGSATELASQGRQMSGRSLLEEIYDILHSDSMRLDRIEQNVAKLAKRSGIEAAGGKSGLPPADSSTGRHWLRMLGLNSDRKVKLAVRILGAIGVIALMAFAALTFLALAPDFFFSGYY